MLLEHRSYSTPVWYHSPTSGNPGDPSIVEIQGDGGVEGVRDAGEELVMSTEEFFNGPFQDFGSSYAAFQGASLNI